MIYQLLTAGLLSQNTMNQVSAVVVAAGVLGCILWFLKGLKSTDDERRAEGEKGDKNR